MEEKYPKIGWLPEKWVNWLWEWILEKVRWAIDNTYDILYDIVYSFIEKRL